MAQSRLQCNSPTMSLLATILLLSLSGVHAWCGDNGGAALGWGSQEQADQSGFHTVLGFDPSGPLDAEGNPILGVVSHGASYDWAAYLCGQASPDAYPQTTFGPLLYESNRTLCLTASGLESENITLSLQPCLTFPPYPTQQFQWVGTAFITYGFAFLGNATTLPVDPTSPTDYIPSLSNGTAVGSYLSFNYSLAGLPASTGHETGLILDLSDDD
ncbi:hypothetical protein C8F01DRAFT_1377117 [Mycena amicta]|nr:hypothetical protein C8F01DRAFT_1377117 [Mycena amicta]